MLYFHHILMNKKNKAKKVFSFLPSIIPLAYISLIILFTIGIFYLAKGYRLDIQRREIKKTAALYVKSSPSSAILFVDNKKIGNTPKNMLLDIGIHKISVEKEGYTTWSKNINIMEDRTTILYPWLILAEPKKTTVWNPEKPVEKFWVNEGENIALILLNEQNGKYSLWKYSIERTLWDISSNPNRIWQNDNKDIDLLLSPDGYYAVMTLTKNNIKEKHIVNTSAEILPLETSLINTPPNTTDIQWAKDNKHLIITTTDGILSYNILNTNLYTLISRTNGEKHIWSTDNDGTFYTVKDVSLKDSDIYTYSIEQINLDGIQGNYPVNTVYMQKNIEYIKHHREVKREDIPFKNSQESTLTVGEIDSITVNKKAGGLFISTTTSAYWYDITTGTYLMISPYPSKLIDFATDQKHLLFESLDTIYTYTFKKYELDHLEQIGSLTFPYAKKSDNPAWIPNTTYIKYTKDDTVYFSQRDGENNRKIISTTKILASTTKNTKDYLILFEVDENSNFHIYEYKLQ